MPLVPMDQQPVGLENLKLAFAGMGATMDASDRAMPQPPLEGSSQPTVVVTGGEEVEYTQTYNSLISQGAGQRFPKTMDYIARLISNRKWAETGKQIGSVNAWMSTPAKEAGPGKASVPTTVVGGQVPPPVISKPAIKTNPWLLIGGLIGVGIAGAVIINATAKQKGK